MKENIEDKSGERKKGRKCSDRKYHRLNRRVMEKNKIYNKFGISENMKMEKGQVKLNKYGCER